LDRHASLMPASLVSEGTAAVLGAPTLNDLNDITDRALEALDLMFRQEEVVATVLPDPAIAPVAGSRAALILLTAAIIRQAMLAPSAADDLAAAVDVVTGRAGDRVCLEISRMGVDVAGADWPLDDLCRLLCRLVGGQMETHLERGEMAAALRLPAVPWQPVAGEICVVDDEPAVREIMCRILSRGGMPAHAMVSAEELERHLATGPPALVLVDAALTDPSRGRLVEWLARVHPELIERIVVLTSSPSTEDARRALAALRREWYLAKPFTAEILLALVRRRLMCLY